MLGMIAQHNETKPSHADLLPDCTCEQCKDCLEWEYVTWGNGRCGTVFVAHGKTKAARRVLPMTPRTRAILVRRWERAGKPSEGWVWPAFTKSGHMEPSAIRKAHKKAIRDSKVRPFVLYSSPHILDSFRRVRL